ncbi:SufS family cysteine desulfurase [Thiomonas sp. 13-64-67]|uniref:SufS family cysteine desulfurase n=1 Tax=Thiomonas sp. 13-64-67 TaxID=1970447 RepID=UPI000BD41546|nr:SufS family cysteine desulfurase [Thiomonas sp. 13-64-67]OZB72139.1 MAG: cysteine sulfinate desulfinase [Thiomonas sp. 13-64-67]
MNALESPSRLAPQLAAIREQFPILAQTVHGKPLVYLDNAATTQKPLAVLEAMRAFEVRDYANVHRGVHVLSQRATDAFEAAREKVAAFVHARSAGEIVFVRGATEAINLVAQSFARARLQPGDEVLVTAMEHHADIVPWQMVCDASGARLRVAPIRDDGALDLQALPELLAPRTRMVAVTHVSNVLGTVNDVASVAQLAHARGVPVLVDGAQAVAHLPVDVQALGVLWGRAELLAGMPPYQGGGDMIRSVSFERTTYADPPARFEAGTPHITGAVGLAAAIDFVQGLGWDAIAQHERALLELAQNALVRIPGLRIYGTVPDKIGVVSFNIDGLHAHDLGTIADAEGVAIRAGHHCAMPLMQRYGVAAMARASLGLYNGEDDIDALVRAGRKAQAMFAA